MVSSPVVQLERVWVEMESASAGQPPGSGLLVLGSFRTHRTSLQEGARPKASHKRLSQPRLASSNGTSLQTSEKKMFQKFQNFKKIQIF